jgi:thiamine biosynthesis protein ThiS
VDARTQPAASPGAGRGITIRLNGDPFDIPAPLSIAALLATLKIDPRRVAVEHNLVVVRRGDYATVTVGGGDQVEIVNLVGGG